MAAGMDLVISKNISDKIKTQIQQSVLDFVPSEKWDELIKTTSDQFVKDDLPEMITDVLRDKYKEIIQQALLSPKFTTQFDRHGDAIASEGIAKILELAAPQMFSAIFGGIVQQMVEQLRCNTNWG